MPSSLPRKLLVSFGGAKHRVYALEASAVPVFKLSSACLRSIFGQLAKVVTHRGKLDCIRKLFAVPRIGLAQIAPELGACTIAYAQRQYDERESPCVSDKSTATRLRLHGDHSLQAIERTLIIFTRAVDGAQDRFVAFDETRGIHLGDKV